MFQVSYLDKIIKISKSAAPETPELSVFEESVTNSLEAQQILDKKWIIIYNKFNKTVTYNTCI